MSTDSTRQYDLPTPISNRTSTLLNKHSIQPAVPESQDLIYIKTDLDNILSSAQLRIKNLKKDSNHLEKNVKITNEPSGKNVNAMLEKMRIKQEASNNDQGALHSNTPKSETSRQAALETIRRRRRREETNSPDHHVRRSESPNHIVKLKKLDHHHHSRSMSPTPSKHTSKETKKKKANRGANDRNNVKEDLDFVRVKPKDQIPVTTFITAMEPYFAPLTEEDRSFLLEKGDSSKPYLIPPLGQYYADAWHEEDQAIGHDTKASPISSRQGSIDPNVRQQPLKFISGKDIADDSFLLQDDVTCGSLTERLLSSLVMEDIIDPVKKEQDVIMEEPQSPEGQTIAEMASDPSDEIVNFEERLKRELQYAGLFGEDDTDWNAKEDDEICAELRKLGHDLKEQVKINEFHKKRLLQVVDCQLQFEQYRHVLDTLDSQVEQCYMKRFRTQKSKKRKANAANRATLSENAVYAMEKRKTWINALSGIFNDKNLIMPSKSIYDEQTNDDNPNMSQQNNHTS